MSWSKAHPYIFRVLFLKMVQKRSVHSCDETLNACIEVVNTYMPTEQRNSLIQPLVDAENEFSIDEHVRQA